MPMRLSDPLQTITLAYKDILGGEDPWVALGNFMNEWFVYAADQRSTLIAEAPLVPQVPSQDQAQWACFVTAVVEYLCQQFHLPSPSWVEDLDRQYQLSEPWYHMPYLDEEIRTWLEETTPIAFGRRNIYCGDRVFLDKQEAVDQKPQLFEAVGFEPGMEGSTVS